ncbi:MAG: hydroxymethylglutaryl-CoA lyase [Syntrophobacteraceae bacterium]
MAIVKQASVIIEENAPRDGIQNEAVPFGVEDRIELINALADAGLRRIQIGSFVHEQRVPQMAGTEQVFEAIRRREGVVYTALVLNEKGLARAMACSMGQVAHFVSASQTHSLKNSNVSVEEAVGRAGDLIAKAKGRGMIVQAGVMNAFGCRYEGVVPEDRVREILSTLVEAGADEISLADTSGVAHPLQVERMVHLAREVAKLPLSLHLHDTFGFGLANIYAAWKVGVTRFDASCGGLGGCPFIPDAAGNVATEDLALLMQRMGIETGIDLPKLIAVTRRLERKLGRSLPAKAKLALDDGTCQR